MLATNYRGPYRIRADYHHPEPEILHPNDAIVRVTRSLICGSDLHLYHGLVPDCRVGSVFGHEFTGIVEEVGSSVQRIKVGDHIIVPFNIACGSCVFCQHQLFGNCHDTAPQASAMAGFFGYSHTTGGYDGGQAEYVRVPFADVGPIIIPDDIHVDDAVLLTDAYPTGYQAAEMADISQGDTVAIFGAGPVGIFAAKAAQWMGAGRVMVFDREDYRLEFVKNFAQCEVYNFLELDDPVVFIKQQTDSLGADACIDCVGLEASGSRLQSFLGVKTMITSGSAVALQWAINSVKKGGSVSVVGVYGPTANLVPIGNALNKGITIRGNQASVKRHIPHLIEHIRQGHIKPSEVISHRVPLEEVGDAYHLFSSKIDNCIKPVLIPPSAMH